MLARGPLQEFDQFVFGQPRVSEDRAKRALSDLLVIRHCHPAKWLSRLAKHDVTTLLSIDYVARLLKRSDQLSTRDDRQPNQASDLYDLFGYWWGHGVTVIL